MIVDAYTHIWESPQQLGKSIDHLLARARQLRGPVDSTGSIDETDTLPQASAPQHLAACEHADKAIVVGFKSHYLAAEVPNQYVADYVNGHPEKMIGFAGVDPSRPVEALAEIENACQNLGMKGIAIAPAAQDFHPASSNAHMVYEVINELRLPMLVHQGIYFSSRNKLEYARPMLLDEVAREYPELRIVVAHLGYPWVDEAIVLLGKHPNVYADVSGLLKQSWPAYNALLSAYQYGVMDKLLFGSGFPLTSAADCIEALYSINQLCQGTSFPAIPREQLRGIVERPTLEILGIASSSEPASPSADGPIIADEEPA